MNNILQKQKKENLIQNLTKILFLFYFIFGTLNVDAITTTRLNCDAEFMMQVQQKKVTVNLKDKTLDEIMSEIRSQTKIDYGFQEKFNTTQKFSLSVTNVTVEEALTKLLAGTNLEYSLVNNRILIKEKKASQPKTNGKVRISGSVLEKSNKQPIIGAAVIVVNSTIGVVTDAEGKFSIEVPSGKEIQVNYLGMTPINKVINSAENNLVFEMNQAAVDVADVIVTGYFSRKMDSYTGNATVVKGADLRMVNPNNVMKALSFLDPDIVIQESNSMGSNPNSPPSIHVQGTSSVASGEFAEDPNLPTFILDGFEVKYQTIYDMDPSRIESIVVLKDAAATAVYGSRAANGVIIVTTVQPKPGKIMLSYNLNLEFSSPDLSSYDLLDAQEKFDFENRLGIKTPNFAPAEYNQVRKWMAGGTNTDWLAQPTRNATSQTHTLNLMGGEKGLRYNLNFNYKNNPGVMKGSQRTNYSVTADIIYRPSEKLNFKNSVTYTRNNNEDSPYGSFGQYTKMNPYFPIYDQTGKMIKRYTTDITDGATPFTNATNVNPMLAVSDGSFKKEKYSEFIENFAMDWMFHKDMRLKVSLSYSEKNLQGDHFVSPDAAEFITVTDRSDVGRYSLKNDLSTSFNGKVSLGYNKSFGKNSVNADLGYEISMSNGEIYTHVATGFGSSYLDYLAFATKYETGSSPKVQESTINRLGGYFSMNYTYDNRFLLDASLRFDGSSQFGADKRVAPFYSGGIGWNLHNERFLRGNNLINQLKVTATYGQTGSVKFSPYQAKDTYTYFKDDRYMDNIGIYMLALGNESLEWQKTDDYGLGFSTTMFKNIFSFSLNYYYKQTNGLLYNVILPSSTGFKSYSQNLGKMVNEGLRFSTRVNILRKDDMLLNVFLNGSQNKNKSYAQYKNGASVSAIYAVPSLGIDPASGRELYLDLAGNPTWDYNINNERIFGDTSPELQGSFGANATYKQFSASIGFSYSLGSQEYNTTLEDKVENANVWDNVDRRVLTDTWLKPGDEAQFGHPLGGKINKSSRFVQDNNFLKFTTLNVTYNFKNDGFIKKLNMSSLQLSFNTSDLSYWSTIKRERGTDYPFARSYTLGLRANF